MMEEASVLPNKKLPKKSENMKKIHPKNDPNITFNEEVLKNADCTLLRSPRLSASDMIGISSMEAEFVKVAGRKMRVIAIPEKTPERLRAVSEE